MSLKIGFSKHVICLDLICLDDVWWWVRSKLEVSESKFSQELNIELDQIMEGC